MTEGEAVAALAILGILLGIFSVLARKFEPADAKKTLKTQATDYAPMGPVELGKLKTVVDEVRKAARNEAFVAAIVFGFSLIFAAQAVMTFDPDGAYSVPKVVVVLLSVVWGYVSGHNIMRTQTAASLSGSIQSSIDGRTKLVEEESLQTKAQPTQESGQS